MAPFPLLIYSSIWYQPSIRQDRAEQSSFQIYVTDLLYFFSSTLGKSRITLSFSTSKRGRLNPFQITQIHSYTHKLLAFLLIY